MYLGKEKVAIEDAAASEEDEVVQQKENGVEKEERIHIISDIVIKPSENGEIEEQFEEVVYQEATTIAEDSVESEVLVTEIEVEEQELPVAEKTVDDSSDVCVIEDDEIVQQNGDSAEPSTIQQNGDAENEVIEIFDEPPSKKAKTDLEENSNESMLDSFVNVVIDY